MVCQEELEELNNDAKSAWKVYKENLEKAIEDYHFNSGRTIYEPCDERYKDWNDQLLEKKLYTNEDIIESCIDGAEGEYTEVKNDYEESKKKEESESADEEQKHHFRR